MTRAECEERIKVLFNQIIDTYREYNPDGKYITVCMTKGKRCSMNNAYFPGGADEDIPIDTFWEHKKPRRSRAACRG